MQIDTAQVKTLGQRLGRLAADAESFARNASGPLRQATESNPGLAAVDMLRQVLELLGKQTGELIKGTDETAGDVGTAAQTHAATEQRSKSILEGLSQLLPKQTPGEDLEGRGGETASGTPTPTPNPLRDVLDPGGQGGETGQGGGSATTPGGQSGGTPTGGSGDGSPSGGGSATTPGGQTGGTPTGGGSGDGSATTPGGDGTATNPGGQTGEPDQNGEVTSIPPVSNEPGSRDRFIEAVGNAAKEGQERFGVPASVASAQAILESGWGKSDLAQEANNYFGIKCADGETGSNASSCVNYDTWEVIDGNDTTVNDAFRAYSSPSDSFLDHGQFLTENPRYAEAFNHSDDPDQFIREVAKAGYATDPEYADKIISLMDKYDLYRFNQ